MLQCLLTSCVLFSKPQFNNHSGLNVIILHHMNAFLLNHAMSDMYCIYLSELYKPHKITFLFCTCKTFNITLLKRRHTVTMPDTNLFEVIELEKIENGGVRIGPEVHVGSVDVIKSHSTFICFKCNRKVRIFQIS